jgi:hypothetical protein
MTRPCRRITLHLSQIRLTLGFTFTAVSILSLCWLMVLCWLLVCAFGYLYRYTMRPRVRS